MKRSTKEANQLLLEGTLALAKMEHAGLKLDMNYLTRTIAKVESNMKALEKELTSHDTFKKWKRHFRDKTKLGSAEQLAYVVYRILGHPCVAFTEKKRAKADEESLKKVNDPFVDLYFQWKKLGKILSTYLYGFRREQINGYLHPSFNFHPASMRSGCSDPNVQNIPSRGPLTKLVRDCFIPRKGRRLVEIDYAQLEVRISACYNKDPVLINYIKDPTTDMHRDIAMQLFLLDKDQVEKKTTRDWAKNRFVFPAFYGSVFFQCAPNLWKAVMTGAKLPNGTTVKNHLASKGIRELGETDSDWDSGRIKTRHGTFVEHVRQVEQAMWNERFKVYTEWKDRWWREYCRNGGYRMLSGFYVHGVFKKNEVLNYAIQGSAFHCLLWSVIQLQKHIEKHKMRARIINEIHDCLVADVPEEELQDWLGLTREVMVDRCIKHYKWLIVPLDIEAEVTPTDGTWYSKQKWVEKNGLYQLAS